jgi:hypothetical protein
LSDQKGSSALKEPAASQGQLGVDWSTELTPQALRSGGDSQLNCCKVFLPTLHHCVCSPDWQSRNYSDRSAIEPTAEPSSLIAAATCLVLLNSIDNYEDIIVMSKLLAR